MPRKALNTDASDWDVIVAFLGRYDGWSGAQIADDMAKAVTQSDVSRWRIAYRGGDTSSALTAAKRHAMLAKLNDAPEVLPRQAYRKRLRGIVADARALLRQLEALAGMKDDDDDDDDEGDATSRAAGVAPPDPTGGRTIRAAKAISKSGKVGRKRVP